MSNSKGSYQTTREQMMKAFDKLPPTLRKALADSDENWVPQILLTKWRRLPWGQGIETLAAVVRSWDMQRRSSKSMARIWGPDHPQAIHATKSQLRKGN